MGSQLYPPSPAKLILGLLASGKEILEKAKSKCVGLFGPIENQSQAQPFTISKYYCKEMGDEIWRQFLSFEKCVPSEQLAEFKEQTNQLEEQLSVKGSRQANLDCGLLTLDKVVLASTKPANYRVYLSNGIYAQATLRYEKGTFHPWPWIYEEYGQHDVIDFFNQVRNKYKGNEYGRDKTLSRAAVQHQ